MTPVAATATGSGLPRIEVMGVPVDNVSMGQAVSWIVDRAKSGPPASVFFVNADCVNITFRNPAYLAALWKGTCVFADGSGMRMAAARLGNPVVDNVNGTDMFPLLVGSLAQAGVGIYLLGARPGVAQGVADWVKSNVPAARVVGVQDGYFPPAKLPEVVSAVAASGAGVLFLAFGAPRQESWILEHLPRLGVNVAIGVGGLFDFYSGRIPRAPLWMRRMGIEWVYRLYQEPRRLAGRYLLGNPLFIYRLRAARKQPGLAAAKTMS